MPQTADECNDALPVRGVMEPSVLTGQVPLPVPLLRCANSQCRVDQFKPHSTGPVPGKCPACYGAGT